MSLQSSESLWFGWIVEGAVAACAGPGRTELGWLYEQGIRAVVRLVHPTEALVTRAQVEEAGLADFLNPMESHAMPTQAQLDATVAFIEDCVIHGVPVAVSCRVGRGRTGTVLAAYLVSQGYSAETALQRVGSLRPGSPETATQGDAVRRFAERRNAA